MGATLAQIIVGLSRLMVRHKPAANKTVLGRAFAANIQRALLPLQSTGGSAFYARNLMRIWYVVEAFDLSDPLIPLRAVRRTVRGDIDRADVSSQRQSMGLVQSGFCKTLQNAS